MGQMKMGGWVWKFSARGSAAAASAALALARRCLGFVLAFWSLALFASHSSCFWLSFFGVLKLGWC